MVAVPLIWTVASLALAASSEPLVLGPLPRLGSWAMRAVNVDKEACGVGIYPGRFMAAGLTYVNLRPGILLYDAGDGGTTIAPNAYNYVQTSACRSETRNSDIRPICRSTSRASGYQQIQCWTDPYDRTMLVERMCLWRRPGACDPADQPSRSLRTPENRSRRSSARLCQRKRGALTMRISAL